MIKTADLGRAPQVHSIRGLASLAFICTDLVERVHDLGVDLGLFVQEAVPLPLGSLHPFCRNRYLSFPPVMGSKRGDHARGGLRSRRRLSECRT